MNKNSIEKILKCLEDEQSKFIFVNRLDYMSTGEYKYIENIIDKCIPDWTQYVFSPNKLKALREIVRNNSNKIIIFGAGQKGIQMLHMLMEAGCCIDYFCDNAKEKQGAYICGIKVLTLDEMLKLDDLEKYIIIVSPKSGEQNIYNQLVSKQISPERIFIGKGYSPTTIDGQYFDEEIIQFGDNEVFVDAGCYDFGTSKMFLNKLGDKKKCKKIYAFEPDILNYERSRKAACEYKSVDINLYNSGLWDENARLNFSMQGTGASRIVTESNNSINVVSLDSIVQDKVTFIKMDIEGAELRALEGAKRTILNDKPKLAISVYHKKDDIYEIPKFIMELVPEYKFYLRHYSNCETETVLYAICN